MSEEIEQEEVEQELDESEEVEEEETQEDEPMVPVAEMKRRLQNERDKLEREKKEELEEAKKLAKMNEDEKREHEFNKLQEELEKLRQKDARYGLSKEASKMLSEHKIHADDEVLQFVVKDDADSTKEAVNAFVELINRKVEDGVKEALSGKAPRISGNSKQIVSQEQFDKMGYSERVALKQKDEDLYNQLNK